MKEKKAMKFLFSIMHPRRLDFFLESLKALDYVDILLAKNMELVTALTNIRDSFLEREYDYLLLTSDDVPIHDHEGRRGNRIRHNNGLVHVTRWNAVKHRRTQAT